ncbi:hypothetical protein [Kordiimonas pumila]|uniref:Glycosyltransferase n=1 Tax=Kordiimonas pumila TaxID=2161677 RepID=A0ABV7D1F1_9PROT|nr:hypothetical protein [Kordiimonas pumila]
MSTHAVTIYFFSNAGEHGYAYAQALGSIAQRVGFGFVHCCEGEPTTIAMDQIRQCPESSIALTINDSMRRHSVLGVPLNQLLKKDKIPHICFVIDHPLYVFRPWMNDGHTCFLFTSPESEAFYKKYYQGASACKTDFIWNVGLHYGTSLSEQALSGVAKREHQLFVPINFDWQGSTLDSYLSDSAECAADIRPDVEACVEKFVTDQDCTPSDIAAFMAKRGHDPAREHFAKMIKLADKGIELQRRNLLLTELVRFPVTLSGRGIPPQIIETSKACYIPHHTMMDSYYMYRQCSAIMNTSTSGTPIHDRVSNAMAAGCLLVTQNSTALKSIFPEASYVGYDYNPASVGAALETLFSGCNIEGTAYQGWQAINTPEVFAILYGGLKRLADACLSG